VRSGPYLRAVAGALIVAVGTLLSGCGDRSLPKRQFCVDAVYR
jgi:hypothetical protein